MPSPIELDGPTFIMRRPDEEQISIEEFHRAVDENAHVQIHASELEGRNPQTGEPIVISASTKVAAVLDEGEWCRAFHFLDGIYEGDFGYRGPVAPGGSNGIEVLVPTVRALAVSTQLAKALGATVVTHLGNPLFDDT